MNYFQHGNPIVNATWSIVSKDLKRRYQMMYGRLPTHRELEKFKLFLSDPKPTTKEMDKYYKEKVKKGK